MLKVKRLYEDKSSQDGMQILVDRVWPRGVKKEVLSYDEWYKELAPSKELRKWFDHDPKKWDEFKKKYFKELQRHDNLLKLIKEKSDGHNVTLIYGAKNEEYNQAVAIKEFIEKADS
ncbi:DUF488 domain-containing protein [Phocicoccus pinnipedialis]|uniref:DUF488 domain-containing protein n=1 Tax=Phocicoccus pinnipedialis TaxID=110845 RepID=A0A6V7RLB8_9BACL|nr:DUF488 family protein [Jeotgalicoccus pinnipedialis]MBP1939620.1 uncharacterized protein YeaO (DUF488 family) [Jeotgalicoccus pinnipedialis]CAD2078963.1 hypothetical protein JEOPIN946_01500 [Jeotgalicoccus pinnipedialis]